MALYRKYRPASFAEVVGQEQVTAPLSTALDSGRINHAYLFSGPRGCGKTSSARILARSLNCAEGPTAHPCGVCESCVSLAPGGPGNLDVMELDAASHNGVEDMRELRERAIYAPAESRYRVFIIDEAHMITTAGSNALLKIVEEPPEHLIFIFATTEPEKVIGTIRSRTHHYPFRLLAPPDMRSLIERIVAEEHVQIDPAVYPLVIQAGGGSPRDTLSILDQLLAGAGDDGLSYDEALPLLGVTDLTLLDDAVTALADGDAAALFTVVGRVIDSGHEPRRFAEDLLDRLRDLMILQTVPNAFEQGLVDAPADRAGLLTDLASRFAGDRLARLAETVNDALKDMRGATSQRLMLEIACAHMLVDAGPAPAPAAPSSRDAAAAAAVAAANAASNTHSAPERPAPAQTQSTAAERGAERRDASQAAEPQAVEPQTAEPRTANEAEAQRAEIKRAEEPKAPAARPTAQQQTHSEQPTRPQPEDNAAAQAAPAEADDLLESAKESWQAIRKAVGKRNRVAEIMLTEAKVLGLRDDDTLVLGHNTGALAQRINAPSNNSDIVAVLKEQFQREVSVTCVVGTDPQAAGFDTPSRAPQQAWNPNAQSSAREHHGAPAGSGERPDSSEESEPGRQPKQTPPASDTWGAPRRLGNGEEPTADKPAEPRPEPTPAPKPPEDWRAMAQAAAQRAAQRSEQQQRADTFSDGVPLPPDPGPESGEPPHPGEEPAAGPPAAGPPAAGPPAPAQTQDDEEQWMADEAQTPGQLDRRDATDVAVELLETELGARRL